MIKVKTFATPIKIFATIRELQELDEQVAGFLNEERAKTVSYTHLTLPTNREV